MYVYVIYTIYGFLIKSERKCKLFVSSNINLLILLFKFIS